MKAAAQLLDFKRAVARKVHRKEQGKPKKMNKKINDEKLQKYLTVCLNFLFWDLSA